MPMDDSIFKMLATQFLAPQYAAMEQAPMPTKTAMPDFNQGGGESKFIDLGAGGPAPGSQRSNALSSLGSAAQQLAPMIGSAMASSAASKPVAQAGAWNNPALGNTPNITAPQLGTPQNFSAPNLNLSLNPSAPRPLFSFRG